MGRRTPTHGVKCLTSAHIRNPFKVAPAAEHYDRIGVKFPNLPGTTAQVVPAVDPSACTNDGRAGRFA